MSTTRVNQRGAPVFETSVIFPSDLLEGEAKQLLLLIVDHLCLEAVRTNATKHGTTQIILKPQE